MSKMSARTEKHSLWNELRKTWKEAYPNKKKGDIETIVQNFWRERKDNLSDVKEKINELQLKRKSQQTIAWAFLKAAQRQIQKPCNIVPLEPTIVVVNNSGETSKSTDEVPTRTDMYYAPEKKRKSPAQALLRSQIKDIQKQLDGLKKCGLPKEITQGGKKTLEKDLKVKRQRLNRLKSCASAMTKLRHKERMQKAKLIEQHPELSPLMREQYSGRPRLEEGQPLLLQTIVDIVNISTSADPKRRDESLRCCRTIDDLHQQLLLKGFSLSRSGLYLRLIPRKGNSIEGKRHVTTVPVKIVRAENNARKDHQDSHFAAETMKHLRQLAELFGPVNVFALSQDDKARVPLGLSAANKQAPILMNLKYRIRLPDHDWVVATKHKLIPSVYAALSFNCSGKLGYSGPTYIAIRSGKHDSSTAASHCHDFRRLMELENFSQFTMNGVSTERSVPENQAKPIFIVMVDGGPDENPRFPKTLLAAISHFKMYDLDAIFIAANAPHHSAFNPVERRMAPLSHDLSGIILPQEFYGTHLDSQGRTTDCELELKNFQKAGEVLSSVWNQTSIDGFDVFSEYIPPNTDVVRFYGSETEQWKAEHVRQSQYLLQILKCGNELCCKPPKTNIKKVLPGGFLPPPLRYNRDHEGLTVVSPDVPGLGEYLGLTSRIVLWNLEKNTDLPYDFDCPSLQGKVQERICPACKIYFPSKTSVQQHRKIHKAKKSTNRSQEISHTAFVVNDTDQDGSQNGTDALYTPEITTSSLNSDDPGTDPLGTGPNCDEQTTNDNIWIITDMNEWFVSDFVEL